MVESFSMQGDPSTIRSRQVYSYTLICEQLRAGGGGGASAAPASCKLRPRDNSGIMSEVSDAHLAYSKHLGMLATRVVLPTA
jgi:hypothetical protein